MKNSLINNSKHGCFVWGTKVTMGDGSEMNIEDVDPQLGHEVLSYNEISGENESKKVSGIRRYDSNHIITIELSNGSMVQCTEDHPIYVNGLSIASFNPTVTEERYDVSTEQEERTVLQLKEGDIVKLSDGNTATISTIIQNDYGDTQTCIIEIVDNHNFYANGILVHNK